jgi:hypothetical protein
LLAAAIPSAAGDTIPPPVIVRISTRERKAASAERYEPTMFRPYWSLTGSAFPTHNEETTWPCAQAADRQKAVAHALAQRRICLVFPWFMDSVAVHISMKYIIVKYIPRKDSMANPVLLKYG